MSSTKNDPKKGLSCGPGSEDETCAVDYVRAHTSRGDGSSSPKMMTVEDAKQVIARSSTVGNQGQGVWRSHVVTDNSVGDKSRHPRDYDDSFSAMTSVDSIMATRPTPVPSGSSSYNRSATEMMKSEQLARDYTKTGRWGAIEPNPKTFSNLLRDNPDYKKNEARDPQSIYAHSNPPGSGSRSVTPLRHETKSSSIVVASALDSVPGLLSKPGTEDVTNLERPYRVMYDLQPSKTTIAALRDRDTKIGDYFDLNPSTLYSMEDEFRLGEPVKYLYSLPLDTSDKAMKHEEFKRLTHVDDGFEHNHNHGHGQTQVGVKGTEKGVEKKAEKATKPHKETFIEKIKEGMKHKNDKSDKNEKKTTKSPSNESVSPLPLPPVIPSNRVVDDNYIHDTCVELEKAAQKALPHPVKGSEEMIRSLTSQGIRQQHPRHHTIQAIQAIKTMSAVDSAGPGSGSGSGSSGKNAASTSTSTSTSTKPTDKEDFLENAEYKVSDIAIDKETLKEGSRNIGFVNSNMKEAYKGKLPTGERMVSNSAIAKAATGGVPVHSHHLSPHQKEELEKSDVTKPSSKTSTAAPKQTTFSSEGKDADKFLRSETPQVQSQSKSQSKSPSSSPSSSPSYQRKNDLLNDIYPINPSGAKVEEFSIVHGPNDKSLIVDGTSKSSSGSSSGSSSSINTDDRDREPAIVLYRTYNLSGEPEERDYVKLSREEVERLRVAANEAYIRGKQLERSKYLGQVQESMYQPPVGRADSPAVFVSRTYNTSMDVPKDVLEEERRRIAEVKRREYSQTIDDQRRTLLSQEDIERLNRQDKTQNATRSISDIVDTVKEKVDNLKDWNTSVKDTVKGTVKDTAHDAAQGLHAVACEAISKLGQRLDEEIGSPHSKAMSGGVSGMSTTEPDLTTVGITGTPLPPITSSASTSTPRAIELPRFKNVSQIREETNGRPAVLRDNNGQVHVITDEPVTTENARKKLRDQVRSNKAAVLRYIHRKDLLDKDPSGLSPMAGVGGDVIAAVASAVDFTTDSDSQSDDWRAGLTDEEAEEALDQAYYLAWSDID